MPDKLKMHSPDLTGANIAKLLELFPGVATETRDDKTGQTVRGIDFDRLRQELSGHVVEGPRERYHLDWPGKREATLAANAPIAKTLRPVRDESVNFDTTQNLFIEGDNLEALKLLQETYLGKVKMIFIDPPYNTGKEFIYDDDFAEDAADYKLRSGQTDEDGARMVANTEANGRYHSDWLSMMLPRLKLARNLLKDDGVIFIAIDDHEVANLRRLCDEVFGEANFVAQIASQVNPRGRHLDSFVAGTHEYILTFARNADKPTTLRGLPKTKEMEAEYDQQDQVGRYRLLGLRNRNQAFNPETRPNLYYPLFVNPTTSEVSIDQSDEFTDQVLPVASDDTPTCWTWSKQKVAAESGLLTATQVRGEWRIHRKDYFTLADGSSATTMPKSMWIEAGLNNDYGRRRVKSLFEGKSVMDFPKPPELLSRLLTIGTSPGEIVLDFFAGSSTTADAVLNFVDQLEGAEKRRFIMVQIPEELKPSSEARLFGCKTIADLSKERILRSIPDDTLGFRVLKIDSSNLKDIHYTPDQTAQQSLGNFVDHIKEDRSDEDLLFQVMLDWGVDLGAPIASETIGGHRVWFVAGNALAACFETGLDDAFVKALARRGDAADKPLRVVFRDAGFADDDAKINAEQIFKTLSPTTEVKVL